MKKKIYVAIVAITLMFANTMCVVQTRKIKCDQSGEATPENPFYGCSYYAENDEAWSAPVKIDCEVRSNFQGKAEKGTQYMNVHFVYDDDLNVEEEDNVVCQFTASANGTVDNVKMLHGTSLKYNNDVVDIIKATPNWSPGKKVVVVHFSEQDNAGRASSPAAENNDDGEEDVFTVVEVMPEFSGGNAELMEWLKSHLEYPKKCVAQGIEGKVVCKFIINKDGSISDIKVLQSVDPDLDREAVRVIGKMPKWKPGKQRGKEVRVNYTLPIKFMLD